MDWVLTYFYAFLFLLSTTSFSEVFGFLITLEPYTEECYLQRVKAGSKLLSEFQVSEGGFLDIDFQIYDPNGNELHSGKQESSARFVINAQMDGVYKLCLGNKMSSLTPKSLLFSFDVIEEHVPSTNTDPSNKNKLEDMVKELTGKMISVKHEQDYMGIRDRIHRSINESTNSRIILWSIFEALILIAMTAGQVYYLRKFFEVRRVV